MRRRFIAALVLTFAAAVANASTEDVVRKGFNVGSGGELRLDANRGNVRIVTGGTGVAVEVKRVARTDDREDAAELFRDHEIEFEQSGNNVIIRSRSKRQQGWLNWSDGDKYRVQWNIRVPANYSVDLKTSGGSIEITDLSGKLEARTSGGSIEAGRITGPVNVSTSGGSIEIKGATGDVSAKTSGGSIELGDIQGTIDAHTSGGSIRVASVNGDITARTSGGNIRIENAAGIIEAHTSGGSVNARFTQQPRGESHLSSSGGSVNVRLAPNVGATIDAQSSGGGIDTDIPVSVMGKQSRGTLNGTINGGGPRLVLRSSGGGINLTRD